MTIVHCLRKPPRSCAHGASVAALLVRFAKMHEQLKRELDIIQASAQAV